MSKLTELVEEMEKTLSVAKDKIAELEGGKKAAAALVRKAAQAGKNIWQQVRIETLEVLKTIPTKKRDK